MPDLAIVDPETGASNRFRTMAQGAMLAKVEVDTDTGQIDVLRLVPAYDVGKAINPLLVGGQIEGAVMRLGAAIMEDLYPYYPSTNWQATNLGTYVLPTEVDVPDSIQSRFWNARPPTDPTV